MKENNTLKKEFLLFSKYIAGRYPSEDLFNFYVKSINKMDLTKYNNNCKITNFVLKYPIFLSCIDTAIHFRKKDCLLKIKLYTTFCILETSPEFSDVFLPKRRNILYLFILNYHIFASFIKLLIGCILLLFLDKK